MSADRPDRFQVTLVPSGIGFEARPGEALAAAAARAGISIRVACRNGVCEICGGILRAGRVCDSRRDEPLEVGATVLLCRAEAQGDLVIEAEGIMGAGEHAVETVTADVVDLAPLNHDVFRVELRLPPGRHIPFHAGQYLAIALPNEEPAWFSIASAPGQHRLELHIQAGSDWVTAQGIIAYLRQKRRAPLQLPFGKACLAQYPDRELVLVAAGTGFAQMKSILDYLAESAERGGATPLPVSLYWGIRQQEDLYLPELPRKWLAALPGFRFISVVGNDEDSEWQGHHDQLAESVVAGRHDWQRVRVIASGSPVMVYTLMDALVAEGLPQEAFLSDVLEYAPR